MLTQSIFLFFFIFEEQTHDEFGEIKGIID